VQTEEAGRLVTALGQLQPEERALLSLRFDEALTFQEIANVLDRPVSTVKSQVASLVECLRTLIDFPDLKGQFHAL
jgi:RNA polymerase sigma factor (sigma-70 family)